MPDLHTGSTSPTITCPFCGLGCDDLSRPRSSDGTSLDARGCTVAQVEFAKALSSARADPRVRGARTSLDDALTETARLLRGAHLPVFGGLCGDLADIRGVLRLAERSGGAVDHRNGDSLMANLSVLEEFGWMLTSLGEARNRADLVVLIGDGVLSRFPRFRERLLQPADRLHSGSPPTLVEIGPSAKPNAEHPLDIQVSNGHMRDFVGVLRSRLANRQLDADPFPQTTALAERLATARYPVIAFAASALTTEPHPDLLIRALAALVRDLNAKGRAALLPMGGADGETSANQVSAWHTGFGIRQSFHTGVPEYRPRDGGAERLLTSGGADLLIWISTLSDEPPPAIGVQTLVLGHPAMQFEREPEVFIPLAVPGVHRSGAIHRGDGVALMPLSAITDSTLPKSADVFARLLALVAEEN